MNNSQDNNLRHDSILERTVARKRRQEQLLEEQNVDHKRLSLSSKQIASHPSNTSFFPKPKFIPEKKEVISTKEEVIVEEVKPVNRNVDRLSEYISTSVKDVVKTDPINVRENFEIEDRVKLLEQDILRVQNTPNTIVSGMGTGGGGGAVWLWDLDDIQIGTPLNGQYPVITNGSALIYDAATKSWKPGDAGTNFTLPVASDTVLGGIKTISTGSGSSFDVDINTGVFSFSDAIIIPGAVAPENDNTQFLGSDTKYFKQVFANGLVQRDTANNDKVILTFRNNAIILTDTTQEITTSVDLGGTIPDPGSLQNVYLDGSGRYAVGVNSAANGNGLVTQEFINSPGQFFVINDIDGGVFGPGDRQCFGLIRETLYDATDLDGGPALWAGGGAGAWSLSPFWYYTGGYPYVWTSYATAAQTPGGLGNVAAGTFGGQTNQKKWWGLCEKAQVGKRIRIGIANGTQSEPTGTNYTNRLIMQLYVSAEMLAHSDASADLPAACITGGVGYYTSWATTGEYENMGSFADGVDKGYRFRWSTFGRTALSQLPYVTGVSTNDQIAAATGLSYYVVYDATSADTTAANVVLATGTTSANNVFYPSVSVEILQFNEPYTSFTTPAARIYELKYTEAGAIQQSPVFHSYPVSTTEEIIENSQNATGVQKLRREVCQEILDAVTGYYLIRDLTSAERTTANAFWTDILTVALAGQLQSVYDLANAKTATSLAPQALLDAVTETARKWINTFPTSGSGVTLTFL